MNKLTKRVLAGIASAAIALTGLFAGASAASAAPETVTTPDTLTFNATNESQPQNRQLKALKIADYIDYGVDATTHNHQYALKTSSDHNIKTLILNFLTAASPDGLGLSVPAGNDEDPLAWAQSQYPAIFESENGGYADANSSSKVRKLAQKLASTAGTYGSDLSLNTPTGSGSSWQAVATVPNGAGLYVIVDDSSTNPSVPMIVGTELSRFSTGTINIKNVGNVPQPKKQIEGSSNATAGIGDSKQVTISFDISSAQRDGDWSVKDIPSKGLSINTNFSVRIDDEASPQQCAAHTDHNYDSASCWWEQVPETSATSSYYVIHLNKSVIHPSSSNGTPVTTHMTIQYSEALTDDVLGYDSNGGVPTGGAISNVHVATNTAYVEHHGMESAPSIASLATSDFRLKKVWGNGHPATGATFNIQNHSGEYLKSNVGMTKWDWVDEAHATNFGADDLQYGNLYTFTGLPDGIYTVKENSAATGANPRLTPSFTVTITAGNVVQTDGTIVANTNPVTVTRDVTGDPWDLVDPKVVDVHSKDPNAIVTNVRNLSQLPMTGAAGIILAVLIAAVLFGAAFILVSIYRRRTAHTNAE